MVSGLFGHGARSCEQTPLNVTTVRLGLSFSFTYSPPPPPFLLLRTVRLVSPIYSMPFPHLYHTTYACISNCLMCTLCAPSVPPLYPHLLTAALCITAPSVHASRPPLPVYYHAPYTCSLSISTGRSSPVFGRLDFLSNQVVFPSWFASDTCKGYRYQTTSVSSVEVEQLLWIVSTPPEVIVALLSSCESPLRPNKAPPPESQEAWPLC